MYVRRYVRTYVNVHYFYILLAITDYYALLLTIIYGYSLLVTAK